jgi:hypothetical protein
MIMIAAEGGLAGRLDRCTIAGGSGGDRLSMFTAPNLGPAAGGSMPRGRTPLSWGFRAQALHHSLPASMPLETPWACFASAALCGVDRLFLTPLPPKPKIRELGGSVLSVGGRLGS